MLILLVRREDAAQKEIAAAMALTQAVTFVSTIYYAYKLIVSITITITPLSIYLSIYYYYYYYYYYYLLYIIDSGGDYFDPLYCDL